MSDDSIRKRQEFQPWTVPYSVGVVEAQESLMVPHILGSHCALHAAKTAGKLAAVFEARDHSPTVVPSFEQLQTVKDMAADLFTEALRFANLFGFDLADEHSRRVAEKNEPATPQAERSRG